MLVSFLTFIETTERVSFEQTVTHELQRKLGKFSKDEMGCKLEQGCPSFAQGEMLSFQRKTFVNSARIKSY